jgi:hypothetical protein
MPYPRWIRRLSLLGLSLLVVLTMQLKPVTTSAIATEPWIPTTSMTWDEHQVRLPDWSQLTFGTLPPFSTDGAFESSAEINQSLGYDLSRSWQTGQSVETVLKLGDFQTSLYPQLFNLNAIAQISQIDLNQVALDALDMVVWQTLDDLVAAIPHLGQLPISQIPPVESLIASVIPIPQLALRLKETLGTTSLSAVLTEFPDLGQLSLGHLGEQLNQFAITDIPGLANIPLQNLRNWSSSTIAGVPGFANVPFDQMPNPLSGIGAVGRIDMVYGPAETQRQNAISGSTREGFQVPCEDDCAHVELTGSPTLHGKQWISGQYQQVKGGEGFLAMVNGGKEPTGRHPFGEAFKVAIWDVDETTGTVSTALFFRICQRGGFLTPNLGCTPYFIGPIPFMSYRETEFMLIGALDGVRDTPTAMATASAVPTRPVTTAAQAAEPTNTPIFLAETNPCDAMTSAISPANLVHAVSSSTTGDVGAIGPYVCDGEGNCGRSLGRYQLMSYQPDVRAVIEHQPGGDDFLEQLDSGNSIDEVDLERFFTISAQTRLVEAELAKAIERAEAEGLTGQALIERVRQLYLGGEGVSASSRISDVHGKALSPTAASGTCLAGGVTP